MGILGANTAREAWSAIKYAIKGHKTPKWKLVENAPIAYEGLFTKASKQQPITNITEHNSIFTKAKAFVRRAKVNSQKPEITEMSFDELPKHVQDSIKPPEAPQPIYVYNEW